MAQAGGNGHARRAQGRNRTQAFEQHVVAHDVDRDQPQLHEDAGARVAHAVQKIACRQRTHKQPRPRCDEQDVGPRALGNIGRAADELRHPGRRQRHDDGERAENGREPHPLLKTAANAQPVARALVPGNLRGDHKRNADHEQVDQHKNLRSQRHRGQHGWRLAPGHDRIHHGQHVRQQLREDQRNGQRHGFFQFGEGGGAVHESRVVCKKHGADQHGQRQGLEGR